MVKHLLATWETLGQKDSLEKEIATHSSVLAWRIPWMEEPGGLQFTGSQRVGHDWATSLSLSPTTKYLDVYVLSGFSCVWFSVTLRTIACQAPLSMGFCRQEYWSGLPCPPPGDLPGPGIKAKSLMSPASAGGCFTTSATWKMPWSANRLGEINYNWSKKENPTGSYCSHHTVDTE